MQAPSLDLLREKKDIILSRIYDHHLRRWAGSTGNVFFISDEYPGLWLEHTYDGVSWADYMPSESEVSANQIRLFIDNQTKEGELPCFVWESEVGHFWTQECVSFGSLCLDAVRQNPGDKTLLADCYAACCKWDEWLCFAKMKLGTGLIETYCGFDTGHDNSGRFNGAKYKTGFSRDATLCPTDDPILPLLAPDMNAVFYGNRVALSKMAELLGKPLEAAAWRAKAEEVKKAIFKYCYNEEDEFFYDVNKHGEQIKVRSISITNVLCEGVTDFELGNRILDRYLFNENEFWTPYPFPSVSISDPTWVQNLPGNSWGYYSQGLTALRSMRWLPNYGRENEMEEIMRRWVDAWTRSTTTQFGQELHPITGEPSVCSQWYSSCMLYYLHAIRRLYGV